VVTLIGLFSRKSSRVTDAGTVDANAVEAMLAGFGTERGDLVKCGFRLEQGMINHTGQSVWCKQQNSFPLKVSYNAADRSTIREIISEIN